MSNQILNPKGELLLSKKFVIDTSLLLYDLDCLFKFEENEVIIPSIVYEELNRFKEERSERGYSARRIIEVLEELSKVRPLIKGVKLGELPLTSNLWDRIIDPATKIRRDYNINNDKISKNLVMTQNDYKIIACALNNGAILISRDRGMRGIGSDFVDVQDYEADKVKTEELYKGYRKVVVSPDVFTELYTEKKLKNSYELYPNEFIIFVDECNPEHTCVGINKRGSIIPCEFEKMQMGGLKTRPINLEQKMLMYLLLDDDIKCVSVTGVSGKGKSLLCVDYALSSVNKNIFNNFMYTKSTIAVDKKEELGFYKGSIEEKLKPHLQPLYSSIEYLFKDDIYSRENRNNGKSKAKAKADGATGADDKDNGPITPDKIVNDLMAINKLSFYPLANIRGMSVYQKIVMLDEAQNTTNHMVKSLVTRMNDNSKLIIAGDIEQIDDKNLNKYNNGLVHLIEAGKDQDYIAHICMDIDDRSRRGKLAEFGAKKL